MTDRLPLDKRNYSRKAMDVQEFKATTESEAALQRQCEAYLEWKQLPFVRIPDALFRAIYAIGSHVPIQDKRIVSEYLKGLPDLTVLIPDGGHYNRAVCFELKTKKGKQSQGQKRFASKVNVIIVRSFEQFCFELGKFLEAMED